MKRVFNSGLFLLFMAAIMVLPAQAMSNSPISSLIPTCISIRGKGSAHFPLLKVKVKMRCPATWTKQPPSSLEP